MTNTPNDDQPGFVAKEPEHCFACFCLIRPGQTYHMTIDFAVLCAGRAPCIDDCFRETPGQP